MQNSHVSSPLTYHKSDRRSIDTIWKLSDTQQFTANVSHDAQLKRYVVTIYRSRVHSYAGYTAVRTEMHDPLNLYWTIPCKRYSFNDLTALNEQVVKDERVLRNLALAVSELGGDTDA